MRKLPFVVVALLVVALLPLQADAQTGKWIGRLRVISVSSTDATFKVGGDTLDKVSVDINPWVFGYRF